MSLQISTHSLLHVKDNFRHISSVTFGLENELEITTDSIGCISVIQPCDAKSDKILSIFFLKTPINRTSSKLIYAAVIHSNESGSCNKFIWARSLISAATYQEYQNELFKEAVQANLSLGKKYLTANHNHEFLQPFAFYGNLLQMLSNSEPLTAQTLIFISRQCIDIVEKLHSLGIYHRDIKPQNFLIDDEDDLLKVYIDGFKFATKLKKSIEFSHSSYYSSLDDRLSTEVNAQQSDIFSLGLTLYTLCTGQPLFEKKDQSLKELERSPAKNWYKIEGEYKKIIDSHLSIPLPLKKIITNFLRIYPSERLPLKQALQMLHYSLLF
jgi:serine/threonine protein kinase